ncbi:MAG: bifunctional riboflavin kinase/FAD synthetase [Alphaproteobacteria bacterium]
MRVCRDWRNIPDELRGGAVALGNFDGVHRGHQALIRAAGEIAHAKAIPHSVFTVEPHPRSVFSPEAPPFRLTPFRRKVHLFQALGVDVVHALRFNQALYQMPADRFVAEVLVDGLGVKHVVVGYDYVFGHKRSGNVGVLRQLAETHGFAITVMEPVTHGDDVCSSTIIRVNLETGRARRAAELLGHWYQVEGRVRHGFQRGRQLGFPTLNVHLPRASLMPALGVYAVYVSLRQDGREVWHRGVANLGRRPTFDGEGIVLEVHVFDFAADVYGAAVQVAFVEHLRSERKFDGLDALKTQIDLDGRQAREVLARPDNAVDRFPL